MADGIIEIEKFISDGNIENESELEVLFKISQINQLEYIQYFLIIETSPA